MSTSGSPTPPRKRDSTEANGAHSQNSPAGFTPVRLIPTYSTDTLERERNRNRNINTSMNTFLQSLRQTVGPAAENLSLTEIVHGLVIDRQAKYQEAEDLRKAYAQHSEDAQARLEKLQAELEQAREDSRLTREDATKAKEAAAKAAEAARLAQIETRRAQTESEALESQLQQQLRRRNEEARLRSAGTPQTPSGTAPGSSNAQPSPDNTQTPSSSSQPPSANSQTPPSNYQPPPGRASAQSAPAPSQTPPDHSRLSSTTQVLHLRFPPNDSQSPSNGAQPPPNNSQSPPNNSQSPPNDAQSPSSSPSLDERLQAINDTLNLLRANLSQTTPGAPGAQRQINTSPREGSRLYTSNLKKAALNSLPIQQKQAWNALLRTWYKALTGQQKVSDFSTYNPVSDAVAKAFGDGSGPGPQGDDLYRLYFGTDWRQTAWNREVVTNMAKRVLEETEGDELPTLTVEQVAAAIWDFVRQGQVSWKGNKPRPVIDANGNDRMEADAEATARQTSYALHREQRLKINTRKKMKYQGRKRGIAELLEDASQQPVVRHKWELMNEVNEALGTEGQSSEESDREPTKRLANHAYPLKVTRPYYRHNLAGELMDNLDKCVDNIRLKSGSRRVHHRVRTRTAERSTNSVKNGLPKALYDPHFLENLTPTMRNRVKPSDYPMPRFLAYVSQVSERMQE